MIDLIDLMGTRLPRRLAARYPDLLWRRATAERVAYLTFDDGPTQVLTGPLLDLLARHDARATFFLLGRAARQYPEGVRALVAAGHTLGNHSFTHPDAWRAAPGRVLAELDATTRLLEDLTGEPLRYLRPPYGRFTAAIRAWCLARRQRLVMWDVMPGDWMARTTTADIERRVLGHLRPGSIVVLHDNPKCALKLPPALETILRTLRADGWRLEAL